MDVAAELAYLFASVATFGENLQRLRERAGFKTARSLADALDVVPSVISKLENDQQGLPEGPTLLKLAKTLNCDVEELLEGVDPEYQRMREARAVVDGLANDVDDERVDVSGHTPHDLPVIAEGEASPQGHLFWTNEGKLQSDVEDRITRPHDVGDPRAYGLRIRGDSMVPIYRPRMTVVVSPSTPVADGDEVYVELTSGERLVKTARRASGGWLLESANPAYPARFVKIEEIATMHPIVWSKRKESGRRVVDDVKQQLRRRGVGRVKDRKRDSDNPEEFPEAAAEGLDGDVGDES